MRDDREADSVGYKYPPKNKQFRPGQSGNPRGRPAKVRNFKTDLLDELREQTTIREDGCAQQISKQRAVVKALVAAAIKGDARATNTLVSLCSRLIDGQSDDAVDATVGADDLDIVKSFVAREHKRRRPRKAETNSPNQQEKEDSN